MRNVNVFLELSFLQFINNGVEILELQEWYDSGPWALCGPSVDATPSRMDARFRELLY